MLKTIKNLISEGVIKDGTLLDLGCGSGGDAFFAAENGFIVTAVDKKTLAENKSIFFVLGDIEDFNIEKDKFDVIYADNSLPFLSKESACKVLQKAAENLRKDGVLYFSLFGIKDGWADDKNMNFWTKDELNNFVQTLGLNLYRKIEEEGFAPKMNGEIKYWHIFRYTLKKGLIT